jgi:hypothetical protein
VKPLAIDLYCGLGGWTEGLLAEGYDVIGFDIEQHVYGEDRYPGMLAVQDVLTLHGSQFRKAALIVASPPCQTYSYMAMPWTRAKAKADWYSDPAHPERLDQLNALFDACFRIQREACEAAGRHIPLVAENVKGAQRWVGPAQWHYGSFYLWGDVPALMPLTMRGGKKNTGGSWFNIGSPGQKLVNQNPVADGVKQAGLSGLRANGKGDRWFQDGAARHGSKSSARKAASARIAKIPLVLAQHIGHVYHPARKAA